MSDVEHTEMRQDDTTMRHETRGNPEVMGRTEPRMHGEHSMTDGELHNGFARLESMFIDDPKRAVEEAERLMEDAFNKMRERIQSIHKDVEQNGDTEHLRLAMRGYRDMIDSMEHGHAA